MPGYLVHQGATVQCSHAAAAQPMTVDPRVSVGGNPIVVQTDTYVIASCPVPPPAPRCVTGTWTRAATRVFAGGIPVVLYDSQSTCVASGLPMLVVRTQIRATGT